MILPPILVLVLMLMLMLVAALYWPAAAALRPHTTWYLRTT